MVKIIEKNKLKIFKIRCIGCSSILSFTVNDETITYCADVPFEGQATDWSIKCPLCKINTPTRSLTDKKYYDWRIE